ncbi:hypothetical protein [Microbacterium sp. NPDC090003]|uniref:hypothetical protein n=1 Tax=Microbacterium sp. NPDC090003 TaxID=3364203 RepID=UPI003821C390
MHQLAQFSPYCRRTEFSAVCNDQMPMWGRRVDGFGAIQFVVGVKEEHLLGNVTKSFVTTQRCPGGGDEI